jgi:hypothetical protein
MDDDKTPGPDRLPDDDLPPLKDDDDEADDQPPDREADE